MIITFWLYLSFNKLIIFNNDFSAFKRLQDKKQFKDFNLENHTLVWGNDLDLAPEFLYDLLKSDKAK